MADFSLDLFSLAGKTAVVTGGNSGLGQAFALAMAKAGANIFIPTVFDDGGETEAMLTAAGAEVLIETVDITDDGAPAGIVERAVERFGQLDIVVNNAGISNLAPVLEFGRAEWDPMIDVNLTGAFELTAESAKVMVPQGSGKIINICSLFSFLGGRDGVAYAATKHAIAGLTKAYCDELGQYGIQVNGIAPGYFATDITAATRANPETSQRILDHIPAARWGDVSDLMGTCVFLASSASDYVNGHVLVVDGGYLVR